MQVVKYYNPAIDDELTFGTTGNYICRSVEGVSATEVDLQTQKAPEQDGATYIDSLLEPRAIDIQISVGANTPEQLYTRRARIQRLFNPKDGPGVLTYQAGGVTREIAAVPDPGVEFATGKGYGLPIQQGIIHLLAPDPLWYSVTESELLLAGVTGGWQYPWEFPRSRGEVGTFRIIDNQGDMATPVLLELTGLLENPTVTNETTGKSITIEATVSADEKLIIDTAFGQKKVVLVDSEGEESNAMHYMAAGFEFWQLIPGENEIRYSADQEDAEAGALVAYRYRYLGV